MKVPERFRLRNLPIYGSTSADGNCGMFVIPHPKIKNYILRCLASDQLGWEHVSVTVSATTREPTRCPTWEEMCYVKDLFWNDDEAVMQLHPANKDYVNQHPFCLHLWRPTDQHIPLPNPLMIGIKSK